MQLIPRFACVPDPGRHARLCR